MRTWLDQVVVCAVFAFGLPAAVLAQTQALRNLPLPPAEAVSSFELMPGLQIQLIASEPQIVDPVSAAFDHRGRLWVVEMRDYPTGPPEGKKPSGTIKILTDEDCDGYFETAIVFADQLIFPTGLTPFRDGVIATVAGKVTYLADTDGDGVCDAREVWFTGFSEDNEQLRANHPTWTLENEIHVASGLRGGEVRSADPRWPDAEKPLSLATRDFRFSPLGGDWRTVAGNSQFGFYQDDHGRSFVCSNRNPSQLLLGEVEQVASNPLLPLPQWKADVMPAAENSQVFPLVQAWTTSNLHAGQFTAACGTYRYQSDGLSAFIGNDFFACEPTGSLVQRYRQVSEGIVPATERGREGVEFLASRDPWFRPVDLLDGPDGAMYVVDMHRAVIEHPAWMPKELQNRADQRWGNEAGRIFRIVPAATAPAAQSLAASPINFATSDELQWVKALSSPNRWTRVTASRLLAETFIPIALENAAGKTPPARFQKIADELSKSVNPKSVGLEASRALWLLETLGVLSEADIAVAISHPDTAVRLQSLRLIARHRTAWPQSSVWIKTLASDPSPTVRYQWLLEFASNADSSLIDWIITAVSAGNPSTPATDLPIDSDIDRQWLSRAVSLVNESIAAELIDRWLDAEHAEAVATAVLLPLVKRLGWSGSAETLSVLLRDDASDTHRQLFEEFANGLATRGTPWTALTTALPTTAKERLESLLAQDREIVSDPNQTLAIRVTSLRRIGLDRSPQTLAICQEIVDSYGDDLYVEALALMRHFNVDDSAKRLVDRIVELPPRAAAATVAALISNPKWTMALVDALEAKQVPWGLIDPTSLGRLERHSDKSIAQKIHSLRADRTPEDRQALLARYTGALSDGPNVTSGRAHFVRHCAGCHKIDGQGVVVGPDISDMRTQTPEQILLSILHPSAAIDANYYRYAVLTSDGQLIEGLLEDSNQQSVTLKLQDGIRRTIPRDEVEQLRATGVSMMPDGFENQLDPAAMRDLIGYVKRWRLLSNEIPLGNR